MSLSRRRLATWISAWGACACACLAAEPRPAGYPDAYQSLVARARAERKVVVYATTETSAAAALIRDFEALYPGVSVEYVDLASADLHRRFLAEVASRRPSADVLWSAAMDLQMKLANDHYAAGYASPEAAALPAWARWRDEAYGTTYEPAVFAYSRRAVAEAEVPQTHEDFLKLLRARSDKYGGNVSTYDIDRSALGFLFATQDSRAQADYWDLVHALGANGVQLEAGNAQLMERIASGKDYLAYNLDGSYALTRARRDPSIGVVLPKDYTLIASRIALLAASAAHPNAGRLWLDYLLSRRGQTVLATRSGLIPIRSDIDAEFTPATLQRELGAAARPIGIGPSLLVFLDRSKQQEFLRRWQLEASAPHR